MHRIWTCPALEEYRARHAPKDWLAEVTGKLQGGPLAAADLALFTRALMPSPAARVDAAPLGSTFKWVKEPAGDAAPAVAFSDASRLDAEHDLYGLCARQGWAIAAFDREGNLVAAAHGRPPEWAQGIHAAELWGLLMAAQTFDPNCPIKVDCRSVQQGAQHPAAWAGAAHRRFARAWKPLSTALAGDGRRVSWVPAHCGPESVGRKQLDDGSFLSAGDLAGNNAVDDLAKQAARQDRAPACQLRAVRLAGCRLRELAVWIGRVTVVANSFPDPAGGQRRVRDAQAETRWTAAGAARPLKRKAAHLDAPPADSGIWVTPRMAALRQRVLSRIAAAAVIEDAPRAGAPT